MALTTSSVNIMSIRNALYSLFKYSQKGCPMKKAILRQYLIPLTSAVPGHAYSIFRADETAGALPTDPKTRTLTMRNPWGSTIPKCASAMARSAHTDDGTFTIDFDDFLKIFGSLEIGLINIGP